MVRVRSICSPTEIVQGRHRRLRTLYPGARVRVRPEISEGDAMNVRRRTKALAGLVSLATAAIGFAVVAAPAGAIPGNSQAWTTPGTYSWVVPAGVTGVDVIAEGGAGSDGYSGVGGLGG